VGIGELYDFANGGREWDPHDAANGHDIAILVRARDACSVTARGSSRRLAAISR